MSLAGEKEKFRKRRAGETDESETQTEYLTILIGSQMFGVPVLQVQDVLRKQKMTRVPLAPPEVAGASNLRGRIVTGINIRKRLGLENANDDLDNSMSVVVEHKGELYSLIIDKVGDVLSLLDREFESVPPTLDSTWRDIATGIFRLEDRLLIIADIPKLLRN